MNTHVDGGYAPITVGQFANVCQARASGEISFLALRVWLAAHEQRARRCNGDRNLFTIAELARLLSPKLSEARVRTALSQLKRRSLIEWSEEKIWFPSSVADSARALLSELRTSPNRPVPVPRYILRAIFRHTRPSEVLAALAHIIRCLFKRGGEIAAYGLVKASWVAAAFRISERSVHAARRWLMEQGFMRQEPLHQLVMNRFGAKFVIELLQKKSPRSELQQDEKVLDSAPLSSLRSLKRSKNQKTTKTAHAASGVQMDEKDSPTLHDIKGDDLRKLPRIEKLYEQAVNAGWIERNEQSIQNFVCAALRATRTGGRVGAIFVGIVRKKLWHHITQEQEQHALGILRRYREKRPGAFCGTRSDEPQDSAATSSVQAFVAQVLEHQGSMRSAPPAECGSALCRQATPVRHKEL